MVHKWGGDWITLHLAGGGASRTCDLKRLQDATDTLTATRHSGSLDAYIRPLHANTARRVQCQDLSSELLIREYEYAMSVFYFHLGTVR